MPEPLTEELLVELLSRPSIDDVANGAFEASLSLPGYLQELLKEKGLARIDAVHAAELNETFGYQIFMGARKPGRDKALQLALGMGCTLRETNRLLKLSGSNELYCKNRRDAIIIYCVEQGLSLRRTNEELYRFGEETVC